MKKLLIIVVGLILVVVGGCGAKDKTSPPTTSAATKSADITRGDPSVGDRSLKLGQTRNGEKVLTTVVKLKDNWTAGAADQISILEDENADRWFAVFVRSCAVGTLKEPTTVVPQDFTLGTKTGAIYNTPSSFDNNLPSPRFPSAEFSSGCREGWVNFALKKDVKIDRVFGTASLYSSEAYAEWRF